VPDEHALVRRGVGLGVGALVSRAAQHIARSRAMARHDGCMSAGLLPRPPPTLKCPGFCTNVWQASGACTSSRAAQASRS
jgi:hypothetical protein